MNISSIEFALMMYVVQLVHSFEELITGFHKKWFLFKMPFSVFLGFEILHNFFWLFVLVNPQFPFREELVFFFIILMFANGLEHVVWGLKSKKYVPGLYTAPFHIILFLIFLVTFLR